MMPKSGRVWPTLGELDVGTGGGNGDGGRRRAVDNNDIGIGTSSKYKKHSRNDHLNEPNADEGMVREMEIDVDDDDDEDDDDEDDDDDPYRFSNRGKGTMILGFVEVGVSAIFTAMALIAANYPGVVETELEPARREYPDHFQVYPPRFLGEIVLMLIRAVITAACGVLLIFAARRRSQPTVRLYIFLNCFLLSFHYNYVLFTMFYDEVYVMMWPVAELFPRILVYWTVYEFWCELRYYNDK